MPRIPPYKNYSLKDLPGEQWKDIPEYVDYYQLSNYGRVKGLERWIERGIKGDLHLKESILKPTVQRSYNPFIKEHRYTLVVHLCRNARRKGIPIGRMVYYLFVRKFKLDDKTLLVIAKDDNNLNVHYKNLQLVKKGTLQERVYAQGKKKRPTKLISQYDSHGNLVRTYP